jgi:hypothetical protein
MWLAFEVCVIVVSSVGFIAMSRLPLLIMCCQIGIGL